MDGGDTQGRPGSLAKGASLGRYVVLGLIGRGGMGEVYAAYDPELNRKIAIKLLKADGGGAAAAADGRQRLLREAQAIARVSNPNVVVVHDVGTFGEAVFVAMEFIEGNTLGYWTQAAKRSWRDVLEVFMAAGRGLVAAHAAGLVHRDFKPDNVMITKTGDVRVMDFGLAREQREDLPSLTRQGAVAAQQRAASIAQTLDAAADPDATAKLATGSDGGKKRSPPVSGYLDMKLTQTGAVLGTPAYMAPEQFAGEASDARTDQFSFSVALWEALYGRRPFAGANVVELMANVVAGALREPPPDARVPGWIRKILLRGMQVDPTQRYPSMAAMLAALARDPAVRWRRWATVAAVVLLAAATGAGARRLGADRRALCAGGPGRAASAWGTQQRRAVERAFLASRNPSAAHAFVTSAALMDEYLGRWTQLYTETCEATHVRGDQSSEVLDLRMACLDERLASVRALGEVFAGADAKVVDNAVAAASGLPMLARCSDVPMLRAVVRPPDDPATRARVEALRGEVAKVNALAAAGLCERAAADGEKVIAAVRPLGYQPLTAEAALAMGRLGETCADPVKSAEHLEQASFSAEMSHHDQVVIEAAVFATALHADQLHDPPSARRWLRHGEAVLGRFPGHPILDAWLSSSRAVLLLRTGETAAAIEENRRELAVLEKIRPSDHMDVAIALQNLGASLLEDGQVAQAEAPTAGSLALMKKLFGNDSARTAALLVNHGEILTGLHRPDEARTEIGQALAIWRRQNADPFYVGYGLLDLGRVELEVGNFEAARASLIEAGRTFGKAHPRLSAEANFALAQACWAVPAERGKAVRLARQARAVIAAETGGARKVAEIDAWLTAHDAGR